MVVVLVVVVIAVLWVVIMVVESGEIVVPVVRGLIHGASEMCVPQISTRVLRGRLRKYKIVNLLEEVRTRVQCSQRAR